jgi:hypothetical protein
MPTRSNSNSLLAGCCPTWYTVLIWSVVGVNWGVHVMVRDEGWSATVVLIGHTLLLLQVAAYVQTSRTHPGAPPPDWPPDWPPPPRARYVRRLDEVILGFDHYCWWLGTPIGWRNRKFFVLFLLWSTALSGFGLWLSASDVCRRMSGVCSLPSGAGFLFGRAPADATPTPARTSHLSRVLPPELVHAAGAGAHDPSLALLQSPLILWALALAELDAPGVRHVGLCLLLAAADFAACLLLGLFGGWHVLLVLRNRVSVGPGIIDEGRASTDAEEGAAAAAGQQSPALMRPDVRAAYEAWVAEHGLPSDATARSSECAYDVGMLANWRQVFGARWWLWPLPVAGDAPQGDGVHWPLPIRGKDNR